MKNLTKIILLAGFVGLSQLAQATPTLIATYTVNVLKMTDHMAFSHCSKIVTVPPDSDVISFYDDNTFVEAVVVGATPTDLYGVWGRVDGAKQSKFRWTYTGNPGERTGTWGTYVSNMETVAGIACNYSTVDAYGATLRFLSGDLSVKTPLPGIGTGTATSKFKIEIYGYDLDYGIYGKGTESRSSSGTFVWY